MYWTVPRTLVHGTNLSTEYAYRAAEVVSVTFEPDLVAVSPDQPPRRTSIVRVFWVHCSEKSALKQSAASQVHPAERVVSYRSDGSVRVPS